MAEIIFFLIAFFTALFAVLTVTSRNIFHSAVWLALCLLNLAGIYFYLNAPFLGVIQVLVYIGGIITLFVFAIKLTAHIGDASIRQINQQMIPSAILAVLFFAILIYGIGSYHWTSRMTTDFTLNDLGRSLMTTYLLPFEFISLILLAVLIGAIVIGKVKK